MASATVRIDSETHAKLRALADAAGQPMPAVLRQAIDAYARAQFLDGLDRDFAALRANPTAWSEEQRERNAWDATLSDGMDD
ncbi:MAG: ribbon-helix-helix protein, CopG family [Pirellulales bacterium]